MTKINELYTKAGSLLRYGLDYKKKTFSNSYQELSKENKDELKILLAKLIDINDMAKEDKIKFKIDKEPKRIKDNSQYNFCIHFIDNINGDSLLFIPTYKHTTKKIIKGYHDVKNQEFWEESKPEDNRIVSNWSRSETIPTIFGWNDREISAKIYLFRPKALIEDNGVSMYINSKNQAEEAIQYFKDIWAKSVHHDKSPIACRINDLIKIGKKSLEKRITEEKKEQAFDDLNDLKEKEF